MKKSRIRTNMAIALTWTSLISACMTENPNVKPAHAALKLETSERAASPSPPVESSEKITERTARVAAQATLDSGITLYNNGDYHGAIKRLGATYESLKPYKEMELQALKFTAFSYCVTGHTTLCRQQFEKALKLDPSFDLDTGENGHPLWGPVFDRVKKREGS